MSNTLAHLQEPSLCGCEYLRDDELILCHKQAHWLLNGVPVCDDDIRDIAGLNGDNETFLRPALDEIADRRQRRRAFIHVMRQPEMRWVREAFKHLRNDTQKDWRVIREIEIDPPVVIEGYSGAWAMRTDRFITLLICPEQYAGHEEFMTVDHHDASNPYCECWWCYDATIEKRKRERVA